MVKVPYHTWLVVGCMMMLVVIVAVAKAAGTSLSTTAVLLALSIAAAAVLALLGREASPSVTEILHAIETKDGRP